MDLRRGQRVYVDMGRLTGGRPVTIIDETLAPIDTPASKVRRRSSALAALVALVAATYFEELNQTVMFVKDDDVKSCSVRAGHYVFYTYDDFAYRMLRGHEILHSSCNAYRSRGTLQHATPFMECGA